jgi:hypothetical protein
MDIWKRSSESWGEERVKGERIRQKYINSCMKVTLKIARKKKGGWKRGEITKSNGVNTKYTNCVHGNITMKPPLVQLIYAN